MHEKVVQIVRDEMDAIGGQEMSMPVLTPAELWKASGRYDKFDVLMKVRDGSEREFVLAATHEETVTFHARELRSYRDLPKILYHFQTKERDEQRPRGGLLRVREFVMKDAYSFDRDEAGLDVAFQAHAGAYERIFERCGLEAVAVQAESGMMGGSESIDYLAPSGSGENTLVTCERGDYAADLEIAHGVPRPPEFPATLTAPEQVETPGITTCEDLAGFLGIDVAATSKAMPVVSDGQVVLALVRGDDRLDEAKLAAVLGAGSRPAQTDEIRQAFGAEPGSLGPVGFSGRIVLDDALRRGTVRRRRESHRLPPARRRARPRLRGGDRGHPPLARGRRVPALRRRPAVRDGDRGRSHLQARHVLLGAARRDLPRRGSRSSGRS